MGACSARAAVARATAARQMRHGLGGGGGAAVSRDATADRATVEEAPDGLCLVVSFQPAGALYVGAARHARNGRLLTERV